jgi:hypothetical protein
MLRKYVVLSVVKIHTKIRWEDTYEIKTKAVVTGKMGLHHTAGGIRRRKGYPGKKYQTLLVGKPSFRQYG